MRLALLIIRCDEGQKLSYRAVLETSFINHPALFFLAATRSSLVNSLYCQDTQKSVRSQGYQLLAPVSYIALHPSCTSCQASGLRFLRNAGIARQRRQSQAEPATTRLMVHHHHLATTLPPSLKLLASLQTLLERAKDGKR